MENSYYEFQQQKQKGEVYEKNFFDHLLAENQNPIYNNPNGNNKEFDIEANGKKYEIKVDFYNNKKIPIELGHITNQGIVKQGWLYVTKSDFIVFYKVELSQRFYLSTKALKNFIAEKFITINSILPTKNEKMLTWNAYLTIADLNLAKIIKKIDEF